MRDRQKGSVNARAFTFGIAFRAWKTMENDVVNFQKTSQSDNSIDELLHVAPK